MSITESLLIDFLQEYQEPPNNVDEVISHSVPIFWFGDPNAKVATVAINPGPSEFINSKSGQWGYQSGYGLSHQPYPDDKLSYILEHCVNYFSRELPGGQFWTRMENVLQLGGASYLRHNQVRTCHFDLVPWATDPVWGELDTIVQDRLLSHSSSSFCSMLNLLGPKILFCRGVRVTETVGQVMQMWEGPTPWQPVSNTQDILAVYKNNIWLLGTRQWYFDNDCAGNWIGSAIQSILTGNTPTPPGSLPRVSQISNKACISELLECVQSAMKTCAPEVSVSHENTQSYTAVRWGNRRSPKLATLKQGILEVPRTPQTKAKTEGLYQMGFTVRLVEKDKQFRISGISATRLKDHWDKLGDVIVASFQSYAPKRAM